MSAQPLVRKQIRCKAEADGKVRMGENSVLQ
jgi:hypothetical protein